MTILNQYEILENVTPVWWYIIAAVFIVSITVMIANSDKVSNQTTLGIVLLCTALAAIIWGFIVYNIVHKEDVPTGRYRYECIIDDDTTFTDVLEDYVIIEQRGDLWILEDK